MGVGGVGNIYYLRVLAATFHQKFLCCQPKKILCSPGLGVPGGLWGAWPIKLWFRGSFICLVQQILFYDHIDLTTLKYSYKANP